MVVFAVGVALWAHPISTMNSPQKSLCRISAFVSLPIEKGWGIEGCG